MADIWTIRSTDLARCPRQSMLSTHFRKDGSCYCVGAVTGGRMTRKIKVAVDAYAKLIRAQRRASHQSQRLTAALADMSPDEMTVYHDFAEEVRQAVEALASENASTARRS